MNTPTPETDAFSELKAVQHTNQLWVDFARKLERERDAAKAAYIKEVINHQSWHDTFHLKAIAERDRAQADCAAKNNALKCADERTPEYSSVKKIIKQALSLNSGAELLERLEKAEYARDSHAKNLIGYQDAWYKLNEANDQLQKVADELAANLNNWVNGSGFGGNPDKALETYSQLPHVKKGKE